MKKSIVLCIVLQMIMSILPLGAFAQGQDNIALFKSASASSCFSDFNEAEMANDGVNDNASYTNWKNAENDKLSWWQVDLGLEYEISKIEIEACFGAKEEERKDFSVSGAMNQDFTDGVVLIDEISSPYENVLSKDITEAKKIRYVRVEKTKEGDFSIGELKIFAKDKNEAEQNMAEADSFYDSYSDVKNTAYEEAAVLLSALGIMNGYSDGTFKPENKITRAEFTAVAVRILGYTFKEDKQTFKDVPKGHWAHSYIETAYNANLINGMGDGIFSPDEYITKQQVVKILVSLLGYGGSAELKGGYPSGYESIASEIDLYKNVTLMQGNEIKRGDVSKLVVNALKTPKVKVTQIGDENVGTVYKENLLMTENLHIKTEKGIVNFAEGISLTLDFPKQDLGQIEIDGEKFETKIPDAKKYLGYSVDYYFNEENNEIVALLIRKQNTAIEIDAEDLLYVKGRKLYYCDENDEEETISLSSKMDVIYNGVALKDYEEDELIPTDGFVTLVDNNGDGETDVYIINEIKNYVASFVNGEKQEIYLKNSSDVIKADREFAEVVKKTSDDKTVEAKITDIKEWNIISVLESKNTSGEKRIKIILCDEAVEGILNELGKDYVCVDGVKYPFKSIYAKEDMEVGKEGIFYLDFQGRVSAFSFEGLGKEKYGYLLGVDKKSEIDESIEIKMFTQGGIIEVFKAESNDKFIVDGKTFKEFSLLENHLKGTSGIYQAVKYSQNTKGEIKTLDTVSGGSVVKDYESKTRYYKSTSVIGMQFAIDNETVMFKIPEDITKENEFEIITSASLGHNQQYTMEAYDCGDEKVAGLVLFTGSMSGAGGSQSMLFLVDEVLMGINMSGDACVELKGLYGGKEVNLKEYEAGVIDPSAIKRGDILTLDMSANGEIKGYEKQFYYGDIPDGASESAINKDVSQYGDPYAFIYYGYGKVMAKKDGVISIKFENSETATYKDMAVYADSSDLSLYCYDKEEDKVWICDSTCILDAKTVGEDFASYVLIRVGSGDVKELIVFR